MAFDGKVVLVTGSSAGIGKATALRFSKDKAKLIVVGRNEEKLKAVTKMCTENSGHEAVYIKVDLSKDADIKRIVETTKTTFGRLDVLINCAGVYVADNIFTTTMENFDIHINTNLRSVFNLTRLFLPMLIESKGNVVNISGVETMKYFDGMLTESMSKAAVQQFTKYIAKELGPKKVRANCVLFGFVTGTEIARENEIDLDAMWEVGKNSVPLGEWILPEDAAETIFFVASDNARHMTGQCVILDGGITTG